jgi:UDPglucose 6-dehydrogenase
MDVTQITANEETKVEIAVLGLGYVGLPTALCLAELGWRVIGTDSDKAKLASIQAGTVPFYEPGVRELLVTHLKTGRFIPTSDVGEAVRSASVLFICVGTPQLEDGRPDLRQVEGLARTIAHNLTGYKLIVEKSTVPAITSQWIKKTIRRYLTTNGSGRRNGSSPHSNGHFSSARPTGELLFDVASNPEFLQEGKAVENFFHPDRIVCGVETETALRILREIYKPIDCPMVVTDLTTAELIKHAANAFLSTKISFINMVADLCEDVGGDIDLLSKGIGLDHRIGTDFLKAGVGFGGYCFPKDLRAFIHLAEEHGVDFSLLKEVERINQRRIDLVMKKLQQALWVIQGKTIGILGLAFKPGTDDIREAPSMKIIKRLLDEGATLHLYDARAIPNVRRALGDQPSRVVYCDSAYQAARGADALLILTEWAEFRELNRSRLRKLMSVPVIVDGRNLYDAEQMREEGFEYYSIGKGAGTTIEGSPDGHREDTAKRAARRRRVTGKLSSPRQPGDGRGRLHWLAPL